MSIAIYSCNILTAKKKIGQLKADENGYREITLGAFDCLTLKNEFYPFTQAVKKMFTSGSELMTRIETGRCRGEVEHPLPEPGMSMSAFMNRAKMINNKFTSHHIKSVRLEEGVDHEGKKIILCLGMIRGSGPFGDAFESRISNPDENLDLSVRSFTEPGIFKAGIKQKPIKLLITWDQVNQGGVSVSNKFDTPSMESVTDTNQIWTPETDIEFNEMNLIKADALNVQQMSLGMESDNVIDSTLVRDALGWNKIELIGPRDSLNWL